ncbi:MAG: hypothetical protein JSW33_16080 [bacterium]|nr:MAG: hypothetical protein JSW33_16080 [bacterium]
MNILQTIFNSIFIFLILSTLSCSTPESHEIKHDWSIIVKELEVILASDAADSVKAFQISILFEKNQIDVTDYREFYYKSTQEKPLENLDLLKEIEQFIGEDMKKEAQQQRKSFDQVDYRSLKKDDPKDVN